MRKKCTRCKKTKPINEFHSDARGKLGRAARCKECVRAYQNKYYNNPRRKKYIRQYKQRLKLEAHNYLATYLQSHPCIDCGETDPVVLEFDHVRGAKKAKISELKRVGKKAVIAEIKKCVVRCANCHRRKTAKQFGWRSKTAPIK